MALQAVLLVSEPLYLQELQRLLARICPQWQLLCASQPEHAVQWFVGDNAPDLLLCDDVLAELAGREFLAFSQEYSPLTLRVLLAESREQQELLAQQTPVQLLLGKPCTEHELLAVFERAERLIQGPFSRHSRYQIGQIQTLPVLRQQALQLKNLLDSPDTDNRQIAQVVARDAGLSARLLQIANSAYLGYAHSTADLVEVAGRLGRKLIRAVVDALQLQEQFQHQVRKELHEELLQRAFSLATLCNRLAKSQQPQNKQLAEHAFVAGLMHIIGPLVMLSGQPTDQQQMTSEDMLQEGIADHCVVSSYLLTLWGFDADICSAVLYRRDVQQASQLTPLLALLHLASYVLELGAEPDAAVLDVDALKFLRLTPEFMALLPTPPQMSLLQ